MGLCPRSSYWRAATGLDQHLALGTILGQISDLAVLFKTFGLSKIKASKRELTFQPLFFFLCVPSGSWSYLFYFFLDSLDDTLLRLRLYSCLTFLTKSPLRGESVSCKEPSHCCTRTARPPSSHRWSWQIIRAYLLKERVPPFHVKALFSRSVGVSWAFQHQPSVLVFQGFCLKVLVLPSGFLIHLWCQFQAYGASSCSEPVMSLLACFLCCPSRSWTAFGFPSHNCFQKACVLYCTIRKIGLLTAVFLFCLSPVTLV